jgi:hypothetical protein
MPVSASFTMNTILPHAICHAVLQIELSLLNTMLHILYLIYPGEELNSP